MPEIKRLSDELTTDTGICVADRELFANYPIHWHEFYEIEFVTEGAGTVIINDTPTQFTTNSLFLMTPTDFEQINIHKKVSLVNISFKSDWINDNVLNNLINGTVLNSYSSLMIERLCEEYSKSDRWNADYVRQLLNCILIDAVRQICKNESLESKKQISSPILQSLRFIRIHFKEPITLCDVADHIGFSSNYFSAMFHREVGVKFKTYVVGLRLEYATKFLSSSNLSVTDICFMSGFNDFANFLRAFKHYYNMSPLQYKQVNNTTTQKMEFDQISHSFHLQGTAFEIKPKQKTREGYTVIKKDVQ